MAKKEIIKSSLKLAVMYGVGTIVNNAVSATTPDIPMGVLKRAGIQIGSLAISAYFSDKVVEYADVKIDEAMEQFNKILTEKKEEKAEN